MSRRNIAPVVSAGALLAACGLAQAQPFDFEAPAYTGSPAGTIITGQNGWYLPGAANSTNGNVYTFAGNPYGIVANASGGAQFEGGECDGTNFVRAQVPVNFAAGGVWEVTYDCLGLFSANGTLPATDNLSSFSLQPSGTPTRFWQTLMNWGTGAVVVNPPPGGTITNYATTGNKFHLVIGHFTAAAPTGTAASAFDTPTSGWTDIPVNNWVRVKIKWDFNTAVVLKCSIQNLTAGTPEDVSYVSERGWYLQGGLNSTAPLPTDIRLFTGSTLRGNVAAYDNISIVPSTVGSGACCANDGTCTVVLQTSCAQTGGIYRGDGTTCATANCPQPGACCKEDGTCVFTLQNACDQLGGVYRGAGVTCVAANCQAFGFTETTDVGDLPGTAQPLNGTGQPLTKIRGTMDLDDVDMYKLTVCNRTTFNASTVGGSTLDTQLWLFKLDGRGVTFDDDSSGTNGQSVITGQFVPSNGDYYLAVDLFQRVAVDATAQNLWNPAGAAFPERAPDGPGAANPITAWSGNTSTTGAYTVTLAGACFLGGSTCYPNCDNSTAAPILNALDFGCFLTKFAAGDTYANCDNSTAAPTLNALDFGCFLTKFAAGCT